MSLHLCFVVYGYGPGPVMDRYGGPDPMMNRYGYGYRGFPMPVILNLFTTSF